MKFVNPWKMKMIGVLCATAVTGCTAMGPLLLPGPSDNKIVAGCIWPGSGQRVTYQTTKGDIYQVDTHRQYARIRAMVDGVLVDASYNSLPNTTLDSHTSFGLRIQAVTPTGPSVAPESESTYLGNNYQFRAAAQYAQYSFYEDRSKLPTVICPSSMDLDGYQRPLIINRPGQYAPRY